MKKSSYLKYSKEQLIKELHLLKKQKKYGLVWEDKKEDVAEKCKNQAPILKAVSEKKIKGNKDDQKHIFIEGDNYHALQVLNYTHKGKIDVIYIDPPYNTGNKDFCFNDVWVDKEDSYRHSKWLSFMEKRLRLAKNLLSNKGAIFISIDDNEQSNLKILCDEIFGEENFINIFSRKTKSAGKSTNNVALNNDFILFFTKEKSNLNLNQTKHVSEKYKYKDKHFEKRGFYDLSQCLDYNTLQYSKSMDYEITIDNKKYYAGSDKKSWIKRHDGEHKNIDWVWRWSKEKFKFGSDNDFIVLRKDRIYTKTYEKVVIERMADKKYKIIEKERTRPINSLEFIDNIYSNDNSKKELNKIFNEKAFDYPKPTSLIKKIIQISTSKNDIVLDFFAGSGTTGHAVMELNKEDGGNRRFILCTNNENNNSSDKGIAEGVCYPRIKKVIEGYKKNGDGEKIEGLGGSLEYLKTEFVDVENINNVSDKKKLKFTHEAGHTIALKENTFMESAKNKWYQIFTDGKEKYVGIYFRENLEKLPELEQNILSKKDVKLYIFSHSGSSEWKSDYDEYENVSVEDIPEPILKVYKSLNR